MPTDEEMRSRREGNESFNQLASRLANAAGEAEGHTQVFYGPYSSDLQTYSPWVLC